jgi:hypothetical protein
VQGVSASPAGSGATTKAEKPMPLPLHEVEANGGINRIKSH